MRIDATTMPAIGRLTAVSFIAVVVFGGSNAIAVRQMVLELPPFLAGALRFGAASLILLGIGLAMRRPLPRGSALRASVIYGLVGFAAAFACINAGLRDLSGGTGSGCWWPSRCSSRCRSWLVNRWLSRS
ncbi:MAG: EamA family transporter [Candidatus Limnocylindrales bacterium]